jgi:hypothetical protein
MTDNKWVNKDKDEKSDELSSNVMRPLHAKNVEKRLVLVKNSKNIHTD